MVELNSRASDVLSAMAESSQSPLHTLEPVAARVAFREGMATLQNDLTIVGEVESLEAMTDLGMVPVRVYRPPEPTEPLCPAIVYFHGGGFVLGDLDMYDGICRRLCDASQCIVVSVDYRLAPEHPFPAGLEDALATLRWLAEKSESLAILASCICVAGDSAGANIATVIAQEWAEEQNLTIVHQLLFYPVTDFSRESEGYEKRRDGFFLTADLMRYFKAHYLADSDEAINERASPLLSTNLSHVPPATILLCGFDPLCDEGYAYAHVLRRADVAVEIMCLDDQIHGFLLMDKVIPEAATILTHLGEKTGRLLRSIAAKHP